MEVVDQKRVGGGLECFEYGIMKCNATVHTDTWAIGCDDAGVVCKACGVISGRV